MVRPAVRDWALCVVWTVLIFVTVPLGNEIRDWLLLARKPAEVCRHEFRQPVQSLSAFPLVSHGRDGFTAFEFTERRLHRRGELGLPHDHATFVLDHLCLVRDDVIEVYRYRKDQPPELLRRIQLRAKPVESIPWREPFLAVRFEDGLVQMFDVTGGGGTTPYATLRAPANTMRMANLLWDFGLFVPEGILFSAAHSASGPPSTAPLAVLCATESRPTVIEMVRGRLLVGEENGMVREVRQKENRFETIRSARLSSSPVAIGGTKFALFVACRNGSVATLDWRDPTRLVTKRLFRGTDGFQAFRFYGDQGFGAIGPRTIAQYNPTPGGGMAIQAVAVFLAGSGVWLLCWLVAKRKERSPLRYAVLLTVGVMYGLSLKQMLVTASPIEAFHFVEYGVLGVMAVRSLRHHLADWGVYPAAFLVVALVGMLDEVIQWLHPARTEDLRDVLLNMKSGALMLAGFAFGAPLRGQEKGFGPKSRRLLGGLLLAATIGLALFIQFLSRFGHEIHVDGAGTCVSRMSAETLRTLDAERGEEFGEQLQAVADLPYEETLKRLEGNWFLYELRVHLFRRDIHFNRAGYFVAYKENCLIANLWTNTVSRTTYRWEPSQVQKCLGQIGAEKDADYRSPVSAQLITRFGRGHLWSAVGLVVVGCVVLMRRRNRMRSR